MVAWGGRTVAKRALGANHASRVPESGWPLPFHEVSRLGGFDCSARGRASKEIANIMHTDAARFFVEAKVAVGKNKATKASKATPAIDNCKGRVQRKVLVERGARFRCFNRCLHWKGAPDVVPGTPYLTAWANSGKSRREQELRLMAIRQARLNKLGLSALATRERSTGERRRVERNKSFCP